MIFSVRTDELVTPFAQVMSALHNVRSNFVLLTNIRQNRQRRGSEGFHLNNRLCQLYEISDGNMIRGEYISINSSASCDNLTPLRNEDMYLKLKRKEREL